MSWSGFLRNRLWSQGSQKVETILQKYVSLLYNLNSFDLCWGVRGTSRPATSFWLLITTKRARLRFSSGMACYPSSLWEVPQLANASQVAALQQHLQHLGRGSPIQVHTNRHNVAWLLWSNGKRCFNMATAVGITQFILFNPNLP